MAMSQKWPNDLQAGKRLIAAFNIVIASSLKKKCGLNCQVTTDHIVVHKVFSFFLQYLLSQPLVNTLFNLISYYLIKT